MDELLIILIGLAVLFRLMGGGCDEIERELRELDQ